ncbi:endonuclease/exonuclease/phosphatase family protein [Gorillibacterium timonense]|uniref:endonuclease/exonuclease/phosphatase family protein n=1 Tax=Gorillibacterium timonense TaxID=1689269 RepID=UPI00071DEFA1|nr:endonuclease/exonuclease/phosphatase family protein [Gorillibacterium timonense]
MTSVKIMTFNLRVMVESDGDNAWDKRYLAAAAAIAEHRADIVCTQEGRLFMLQELEAELDRYAWIGAGRKGGHEDEHCAIFYDKEKWQIAQSGDFGLSENPEQLGVLSWKTDYPRMCTWARLRSVDGSSEFAVFNTHLDHISEEAQVKGMELIRDRIGQFQRETGLPVLLTGDFNVEPDHAVIHGLERAGYTNAYSILPGGKASIGCTFHDFKGGVTGELIDYIFTTPQVTVEQIEIDRSRYQGRYPSDHYPVCALVSWEGKQ